jgi:hypothetical protein
VGVSVCVSGGHLLCLSALSWGVPGRDEVGTPSEGKGSGWKPRMSLSFEIWLLHVLPATLVHLSHC